MNSNIKQPYQIEDQITTVGSHGCIINTKLLSCVDIIRRTSLGFPAGALKLLVLGTHASRIPAVKTS